MKQTAKETLKKLIEKLRNSKKPTDESNLKPLLQKSFFEYSKAQRTASIEAFARLIKQNGCIVGEEIKVSATMVDFELNMQGDKFLIRAICEDKPFHGSINGVWGINPRSLRNKNK